jgi:integrase/recombinase XerD
VRWLQEVRRFKPSTVSRRLSVVVGFYRTCVIDAILDHSPAEYVRRPSVPPESPTLGLSHLQFEAMITAARTSPNPFDCCSPAIRYGCSTSRLATTGA